MKIKLLLAFVLALSSINSYSQDSIPLKISTNIFYDTLDEWIHLKISNILTNDVVYDSSATVTYLNGFKDTLFLDSGIYKCEIIDIGANVSMPKLILDNGETAVWGYPLYSYYLFTLPASISYNTNDMFFSKRIKYYPNPTKNFIKLEFNESISMLNIDILNQTGQVLENKYFENKKSLQLDLNSYPPGIYFLKIIIDKEVLMKKVLKE